MVDVGVMDRESRALGFEVVGSTGVCFFEVELGRRVGGDAGLAVVDATTDGCCVVPEVEEGSIRGRRLIHEVVSGAIDMLNNGFVDGFWGNGLMKKGAEDEEDRDERER